MISINDSNIQEGTKSDVERLESECGQSMRLVLRSIAPATWSNHEVPMYPDMESLANMGLKLFLVIKKENNRHNHTCIKYGDTLLKVDFSLLFF